MTFPPPSALMSTISAVHWTGRTAKATGGVPASLARRHDAPLVFPPRPWNARNSRSGRGAQYRRAARRTRQARIPVLQPGHRARSCECPGDAAHRPCFQPDSLLRARPNRVMPRPGKHSASRRHVARVHLRTERRALSRHKAVRIGPIFGLNRAHVVELVESVHYHCCLRCCSRRVGWRAIESTDHLPFRPGNWPEPSSPGRIRAYPGPFPASALAGSASEPA